MLNLVGYLNHVVGLGESARQFEGALTAAGIPHAVAAIDLGEGAPRLPEARAPWLGETELPHRLTILWCNPDRYGIDIDPDRLPTPLVYRWAWELPVIPEAWARTADRACEIWTPSRFVCDAVSAAVEVPVRVVPVAVEVPAVVAFDRSRWRIDAGKKLFLFMFDFHSTAARKNPLGLIAAFSDAFADADEMKLLIKTINAADLPESASELDAAAAEHPGVRVIDVALAGPDRSALLAGCDCYVSLHRSEGFGITIAEAMSFGRPVIATDYGGSVDFLDASTGYPVAWQPVSVAVDNPVYPADGVWAEPDLKHAAELMRQVIEAPEEAARRGSRAASRVATSLSPAAVGRTAARELERLRARLDLR